MLKLGIVKENKKTIFVDTMAGKNMDEKVVNRRRVLIVYSDISFFMKRDLYFSFTQFGMFVLD